MVNKNLVLLSYGKESEYRRAVFCILSFCAWYDHTKNTKIIIYTDDLFFFKKYLTHINIEYVHLSKALLEELTGVSNYSHRIKVASLDLTFKRYPDNDIIFIDSDTFFYKSVNPLMNGLKVGESFMHKREYTLGESILVFSNYGESEYPTAFMSYIKDKKFSIGDNLVSFSESDYIWNSGVLAVTKDVANYMPAVFKLTDAFYSNSKWFISEQLAFSLVLQCITKVNPAEKYLLHYWGKSEKILMDVLIKDWINRHAIKGPPSHELVKATTKKWKKAIEISMIIDQAEVGIRNNDWYFVCKKVVQLIINKPKALILLLLKLRK